MSQTEFTIIRHINSLGCELAVEWCTNDQQIRKAVLEFLDLIEDGDSITFEVVKK